MLQRQMLILVGFMLGAAGLGVLTTPFDDALIAQDPSISAHINLMTPTQIGWMFFSVGVFAVGAGFFKKLLVGYGAAMFVTTFWSLLFFVSWYETGYWRCVYSVANYGLLSVLLFMAARTVTVPKKTAEKLASAEIPPEVPTTIVDKVKGVERNAN